VDRIRELHTQEGVSALLVLGGSGDYLDVADTVISMDAYRPRDVTAAAREIARERPTGRSREPSRPLRRPAPRTLRAASLPPGRKGRSLRIKVLDEGVLRVGEERLDLQAVEQLLLFTQLRTVAAVLETLAARSGVWDAPLPELLREVSREMARDLDAVDSRQVGDLAWIRPLDMAAALNRLRTLQVQQ
jgi:predicted ABC-class ATPase